MNMKYNTDLVLSLRSCNIPQLGWSPNSTDLLILLLHLLLSSGPCLHSDATLQLSASEWINLVFKYSCPRHNKSVFERKGSFIRHLFQDGKWAVEADIFNGETHHLPKAGNNPSFLVYDEWAFLCHYYISVSNSFSFCVAAQWGTLLYWFGPPAPEKAVNL